MSYTNYKKKSRLQYFVGAASRRDKNSENYVVFSKKWYYKSYKLFAIKSFLVLCFLFSVQNSLPAEHFQWLDFIEILGQQPEVTRFNFSTRRFQGTESDFQSVSSLSEKLQNTANELELLLNRRKAILKEIGSKPESFSKEKFWEELKEISLQAEGLVETKQKLSEKIERKGKTSDTSIIPMILRLSERVLERVSMKSGIVLNRLPFSKSPGKKIGMGVNPYLLFLWNKDPRSLERHLEQNEEFGRLFPNLSIPLIDTLENGERSP